MSTPTPIASAEPLSIGQIAQRIQLVRGHRVILDTDLAAFYGETTKRFNQQVRRNLARFPADFMFQLDAEEVQSLRLRFATLDATVKGSKDKKDIKPGRGRYSKYLPLAFTEHGAIMAATLLNSARATEISVHVVRAFVEWRSMLASNRELAKKLHQLEREVSKHDDSIGELIEAMQKLLATPEPHKRPIGFVHSEDAAKTKAEPKPEPKAMKAGEPGTANAVKKVARKK
jgi:ORF6N domain